MIAGRSEVQQLAQPIADRAALADQPLALAPAAAPVRLNQRRHARNPAAVAARALRHPLVWYVALLGC
eukprot:4344047-Pyramimonas_sp.AAC.1